MLKKLDELYKKYYISNDPEERAKLLKQIEYLNIVIKRELKNYIDRLPISEIQDINRTYNLSEYDSIEEIKKAIFTRLNVPEIEDVNRFKRKIMISKLIVEIAKKHHIPMEKEEDFNNLLSNLLAKINSYDLRTINAYLEYEQLDYVISAIWYNEACKHDGANKAFVSEIKELYGEKVIALESKSNSALIRFFKSKLTSFELEVFTALLTNKALRPDHSLKGGSLIYRINDLSFYDQFLDQNAQVTVNSSDIVYGLSTTKGDNHGIKR